MSKGVSWEKCIIIDHLMEIKMLEVAITISKSCLVQK